jgi:hypothetical protein
MRTKGKVSRASEVMTVVRHFEPDMARQVRALLLVLGSAAPDKFEEDQGEGDTDPSDRPQLRLARGGRGSNRRHGRGVSNEESFNDTPHNLPTSSDMG